MAYELTGKIYFIADTVQRTESFKTREFIIEQVTDVAGKIYSNYIKLQLTQDRTGVLDKHYAGDDVKVHFNLRGSKYVKDGRENYITNLDAWKIEGLGSQSSGKAYQQPTTPAMQTSDIADDDLPF